MRRELASVLMIALFVVAMPSCRSEGPRLEGRVFLLHSPLLPDDEQRGPLVELTAGAAPNRIRRTVLADEVLAADISPDLTRIAYSTRETVFVRELQTGAVTKLSGSPCSCLKWSPSGSRFSCSLKSVITVRSPEGGERVVWDGPTAIYSSGGTDVFGWAVGDVREINGAVGCGSWLSENRLIFSRFAGELPKSVTFDNALAQRVTKGGLILPNKTTVAAVDPKPSLADHRQRFDLIETCLAADLALVRFGEPSASYLVNPASDILELDISASRPVPFDSRFVAATCGVASVAGTTITVLESGNEIRRELPLDPWSWAPAAAGRFVMVAPVSDGSKWDESRYDVVLYDLGSGGYSKLAEEPNPGGLRLEVVGWSP